MTERLEEAYDKLAPARSLIRKQAFEFALTAASVCGRTTPTEQLVAAARLIEAYLAGDK